MIIAQIESGVVRWITPYMSWDEVPPTADNIVFEEIPEGIMEGWVFDNETGRYMPPTEPVALMPFETATSIMTLANMGVVLPPERVAEAYGLFAITAEVPPAPDGGQWAASTYYAEGTVAARGSSSYQCLVSHVSQTGWEPENVPSLWKGIKGDMAEWVRPAGSHDAYMIGDKVTFQGSAYECVMDYNIYSPTEYPQGWKLL